MTQYRETGNVFTTMLIALAIAAPPALAFNSGSTGTDGAFNPTVTTQVELPPDGIFNYTSVNIPTGVTVTYKRNTTNTPVVMLASGNVIIAGTIDLSGGNSTDVGAAGTGNVGDDGLPGIGGPGGYDGGVGGTVPDVRGGNGLGPGGGVGGSVAPPTCTNRIYHGAGGAGFNGNGANSDGVCAGDATPGGLAYGTSVLLPLIGGSGGGGGPGGTNYSGSGGGGGGGAMLIASSATVSITGAILANGGKSGNTSGSGSGSTGSPGSGGAIRIVATTISGNGTINAITGVIGNTSGATASGATIRNAGASAPGRVRFEAETFTRTAASNPVHTFSAPGPTFVAGLPALRIASVAGVPAPVAPTGNADITLPATTTNPVPVTFETTGVPTGNTVKLTVKPANGAVTTVTSPALAGNTTLATASVNVTLPTGPSVLEATTTYTIVASLGEELSKFAQGERVEHIELSASTNGPAITTLITVSGKRYSLPSAQLSKMAVEG